MNESKTNFDPLVLLEQMLQDMKGEEQCYHPTEFWRAASERIVEELKREGFPNFRCLATARSFFVPSYGPPGNMLSQEDLDRLERGVLSTTSPGSKKHLTLMGLLNGSAWALSDYRVFLAGDRRTIKPDLTKISESATGNPPDQFFIEERAFSRSMLNYLHGLIFLKQELGDAGIKTVLEIGGGFGTLGEILHQCRDGYTYIDVDIPPTSAVASFYLSQIEGLHLHDYQKTRSEEKICIPGPGSQMVLCPWQLPRLQGQVDLLWNYISFQEMEPEVVRFYLDHATRLNARYVLLRNLREGKQKKKEGGTAGVETPILGVDYDTFLPDYRLLATNVFPFGYRTVDGFHSELRLYERK